MIQKYKKRPIVVEAVKWTGKNYKEIQHFAGADACFLNKKSNKLFIAVKDCDLRVDLYGYIVKGVDGEFYPCSAYVFDKIYEVID